MEKLTAMAMPGRKGMVLVKIWDTEYVLRAKAAMILAFNLDCAANDSLKTEDIAAKEG